jgi:hypothetical protein
MKKIDRETMTPLKFWCRALSGGLMAQLDWLASVAVIVPPIERERSGAAGDDRGVERT